MKLVKRPRRLRANDAIRRLVAESQLGPSDLIWPLFIHSGEGTQDIGSLPVAKRLDEKATLAACEEALQAGIPAVAIFPVVDRALLSDDANEAYNEHGLVQSMVRRIKERYPELLLLVDVALDPFTSHGHDGVLDEQGRVANDPTVEVLVRQALSLAAAGADIVAPSDMMDGRIGAIREALEERRMTDVKIMAYSAKYASCFYGPFRDAIGSGDRLKGGKQTYQLNPANIKEAMTEIELDIEQGADMVMVKPGMPYLDVVREAARTFHTPLFAYQVSGEAAMICAAGANGWLNREQAICESLLAFKRAGCAGVLSYFALEACGLLANR